MTRFRTRDQEYENERRSLAPYACFSDEAADTRLHPDGPAAGGREAPEAAAGVDDPRTPYQHDRDRILHSVAFRRLQYKTQVYVFHEGDFYRTRLTHTLEVAQIAKGLAQLLRVNQDLVEAISLAHDVGHPPFGHAGEETLDWLMAGHGGFEHNRQALRVVDELETRYPHFPGLNLTRDTREGIAKHATFFDTPREVPEFAVHPNPSLEAQLSGLADMVAYCTHDIEDALRVRIVRSEEIAREVPLWARALEDQPEVGTYLGRAEGLRAEEVRVRTAVRNLIRLLIRDAAQATAETLERIEARSVDDIRRRAEPVACFSPEVRRDMMRLQEVPHGKGLRGPPGPPHDPQGADDHRAAVGGLHLPGGRSREAREGPPATADPGTPGRRGGVPGAGGLRLHRRHDGPPRHGPLQRPLPGLRAVTAHFLKRGPPRGRPGGAGFTGVKRKGVRGTGQGGRGPGRAPPPALRKSRESAVQVLLFGSSLMTMM